jgi:hypothetical protein
MWFQVTGCTARTPMDDTSMPQWDTLHGLQVLLTLLPALPAAAAAVPEPGTPTSPSLTVDPVCL